MHRRKAAAGVEVKQVIGSLCRLLAACGLEAVPPPETFRRAKFDGGAAVEEQFWKLLGGILQGAGLVASGDHKQQKGDLQKQVAAGLWQTGYYAEWLWCGQDGEGGGEARSSSSRGLLLALGWLLAGGALEKLLTRQVQQLDRTLLTVPAQACPQPPGDMQVDAASLRKLQWLIGRLRFQGRSLLSMQEERARLLHAILSAILPSSVPSSDQNSTVLMEDCACMLQFCDLLEAYLTWKQVEKVFWTWMDSVTDLMETVDKKPAPAANRSATVCRHGQRGLETLEGVLSNLPTRQEGQRRGAAGVEDRDGQVKSQRGSPAPPLPSGLSLFPSMEPLPHFYRAKLQSDRPVKGSSRAVEGPQAGAEAPGELPSSQVAQLLRQTEALLTERRDKQRLANRMLLQDLIGQLEDLVLIPP